MACLQDSDWTKLFCRFYPKPKLKALNLTLSLWSGLKENGDAGPCLSASWGSGASNTDRSRRYVCFLNFERIANPQANAPKYQTLYHERTSQAKPQNLKPSALKAELYTLDPLPLPPHMGVTLLQRDLNRISSSRALWEVDACIGFSGLGFRV